MIEETCNHACGEYFLSFIEERACRRLYAVTLHQTIDTTAALHAEMLRVRFPFAYVISTPHAAYTTVATNLRTGPYCCESTNLRTGLDQWTRQSMPRGHARAITNDLQTNLCGVPTRAWAGRLLKNDRRD